MASAAMPAIANFFMRTSFARLAEDEPAQGRIQLTVWTEWLLLPRCNPVPLSVRSYHSEQPRQPQRNLGDVGNQPQEDQHRTQPRQHRNGDFADPHFGNTAGDVEVETHRWMTQSDFRIHD